MLNSQGAQLLIFFLLTLLAEILGTIGGFGSSLFFVSIFQFVYDFQLVLALTGVLHVFSNTTKVYLFRKAIDWKLVAWLGISSVALAVVGAILTTWVTFHLARRILGVFLIGFSLLFFVFPKFAVKASLRNSIIGGGFAGFMAGFIGTGGAIRGLVLAAFRLERNVFVGTSAAIDFGVDLSRTIIYLESKFLSRAMWIYIPVLFLASLAGSYLGKVIIGRFSEETFRRTLLALIFLTGILLVVGSE